MSQQQQQQQVNENDRKLRPVFEYLDNGSYKKALQEIDKLLKKNPSIQYYRALKALALVRNYRYKEATDILNILQQEMPYDEMILQTMSICYREMKRNDLPILIYENALKKDSNNEKLYAHLFMSYVRMNDYKKQQLTALNLYKLHPKNPYYCWAIMSIYMQAITNNDKQMSNKIILPLAERMCEKLYKEKRFESESEYDLYLMILNEQKNYTKMLSIIDERGYKSDDFNYKLEDKCKLLKFEKRFNECFECYIKLINCNNDQYDYYMNAFDLALELDKQAKFDPSSSYVVKLLKLIQQMCIDGKTTVWKMYNANNEQLSEDQNNNKLYKIVTDRCPRSPFMALIIILNKIFEDENSDKSLIDYISNEFKFTSKNIIDLIFDYYSKFGHKYVCIKDLIFIFQNLTNISDANINDLLIQMKFLQTKLLNENSNDHNLDSILCYDYIEHYFDNQNPSSSINDRLNVAEYALKKYLTIEQHTNSSFIYLFIMKLFKNINIYNSNSDEDQIISELIFESLAILESAMMNEKNTTNFYLKLLQIKLYNSIAAGLSSQKLYDRLEIKLIQNDTLGYLFLPTLQQCSLINQLNRLIYVCLKFYNFNFKETADSMITCYKNGCFTKIEEIIQFNEKLRQSIYYHLFYVYKYIYSLLMCNKFDNSYDQIIKDLIDDLLLEKNFTINNDKICDNRDLNIINSYNLNMNNNLFDMIKPKTFNNDIEWLSYQYNILKLIGLGNYLSTKLWSNDQQSTINDNEDNHRNNDNKNIDNDLSIETYAKLIEDLKKQQNDCRTIVNEQKDLKYFIDCPQSSRLIQYFTSESSKLVAYFSLLTLKLFQFISVITNNDNNDQIDRIPKLNHDKNLHETLINELNMIENEWKNNETLKGVYKLFNRISVWIEVLNIITILFSTIIDVHKRKNKMMKKLKKRLESQRFVNVETFFSNFSNLIQSINEDLNEYFELFLKILQGFDAKFLINNTYECKYFKQFEISESIMDTIRQNICSSYEQSKTDMIATIQAKQRAIVAKFNLN